MAKPLAGIRVLDFTRVLAGPTATQILSGLGADIIKIERPGSGDDTRAWGPPFLPSASAARTATYFLAANSGKQSVALDFSHDAGRAALLRLVGQCDVMVDNFRPGTMEKYGLGPAAMKQLNPQLVTASLTAFGPSGLPGGDGPRTQDAGYDVSVAALGGLLHITGQPDGPPSKPGVALTDQITGLYLAIGILSALLGQARCQQGPSAPHVDTSLFEAQLASLANVATASLNAGVDGSRWGTAHPSVVPYQAMRVAGDQFILLAVMNDDQFARLAVALDRPEWAQDPKFKTNAARVANREELLAEIQLLLLRAQHPDGAALSREDWLAKLSAAKLAATPINSPAEALADAQTAALGLITEYAEVPSGVGAYRAVSPPVRFDGQLQTPATPAPALGQHTAPVLTQLAGMTGAEIEAGQAAGWLHCEPAAAESERA